MYFYLGIIEAEYVFIYSSTFRKEKQTKKALHFRSDIFLLAISLLNEPARCFCKRFSFDGFTRDLYRMTHFTPTEKHNINIDLKKINFLCKEICVLVISLGNRLALFWLLIPPDWFVHFDQLKKSV